MQAFTRLAKDFRLCDFRRSGCGWIRTTEAEKQQIYSLPHLATLEHTLAFGKSRYRMSLSDIRSSIASALKITNIRYASVSDFGLQ